MTRVECVPSIVVNSIDPHVPHMSCLLFKLSDCHSQSFCDVCKYMFRMERSNGHYNDCSNCVFKVYALYIHCSTVYKDPHRLGSTILCLSTSSLLNTIHHSLAHYHPMAVNNESTFYHGDNDMYDNNDSSTRKDADNNSNLFV